MTKLIRTNTTLVDIIVVARSLPEEELQQIAAFGGNTDSEAIAVGLRQNAAFMWTLRTDDDGEPLVVFGAVQTGPTIYRTFFLANARAWDEFGKEVTNITIQTIDEVKEVMGTIRLETYCLPEREKARRWYDKIGLKFDAELDGFGVNGESAVLYSTVAKPSKIEMATVADLNSLDRKVN